MSGTTTNNGWTYPTSTDYVKDGATAIQTLASGIDTSTGKGLIAWQTWSPTLSGGWANGNGTWAAYYCQIGKTVHVQATFTIGSTTTKGTGLTVSLPVTAARNAKVMNVCYLYPGTEYTGLITIASTTTASIGRLDTGATYLGPGSVTATVPGTWATGHVIAFSLTYEAA